MFESVQFWRKPNPPQHQGLPTPRTETTTDSIPMDVFSPYGISTQAGTHRGSQTVAQSLPSAPTASFYDAPAFRHDLAEAQLAHAHEAYNDKSFFTSSADALHMFLDARAISMAHYMDQSQESRQADRAGMALVCLTPESLIASGFTDDRQCAVAVLAALRRARILDGQNRVSRGLDKKVEPADVGNAIKHLTLSDRQRLKVLDIVMTAKFFYDFGVREARNAFQLEVVGSHSFKRKPTWGEWVKFLFDPNAETHYQKVLQQRLIEFSLPHRPIGSRR